MNTLKTKLQTTRNEDGFTLMELIIVVVIIAILAAIAIPIFSNQQKAAVGATLKSDVTSTGMNVAMEFLDNASASDLSATKLVKSGDNTVTVYGDWKAYTIRAENPNASPSCWQFMSITGQYSDCAPPAQGGGNASCVLYGSWSVYDEVFTQVSWDVSQVPVWNIPLSYTAQSMADEAVANGGWYFNENGDDITASCKAEIVRGASDAIQGNGYNP